MKRALTGLNPRKACGCDGILSLPLKDHAEDLAPVLTHHVNISYVHGTVPVAWKTSNVCLITKTSNSSTPIDWRPLSLMSCFGKIQERFIIHKPFPTVMSECKNQYAYLPRFYTKTALVKAIQQHSK